MVGHLLQIRVIPWVIICLSLDLFGNAIEVGGMTTKANGLARKLHEDDEWYNLDGLGANPSYASLVVARGQVRDGACLDR